MSGIDNSYKIDGDVLLVIHASIPPGVDYGVDRVDVADVGHHQQQQQLGSTQNRPILATLQDSRMGQNDY